MTTIPNDIQSSTVYFASPGKVNTDRTLQLAKDRASELGIKTILVATTKGDTAVKAATMFKECRVVAVSHSAGFKEPNSQEMTTENMAAFKEMGGGLLTTAHAFGGVERAVRKTLDTYLTVEIVSQTLRSLFGPGIKVVCEIALMAADAGLVRTDEDVVAIAGTSYGADTAVVIRPACAQHFFDLRVKELICKPRG